MLIFEDLTTIKDYNQNCFSKKERKKITVYFLLTGKRLNTRISTLSFAAHMNIPEVKESSGNACGTTPDP